MTLRVLHLFLAQRLRRDGGTVESRPAAMTINALRLVLVPATIGHYKKFDDKNMYQAIETARAIGGTARRIEFDASDPTYNCKPNALEIAIDDSERDAAGNTDPILLEQSKTGVLVKSLQLKPSAEAKRLVFTNNDLRVVDGPFTESKELLGGFAVMDLSGMGDAIELCRRYAEILGDEPFVGFEFQARAAEEYAR